MANSSFNLYDLNVSNGFVINGINPGDFSLDKVYFWILNPQGEWIDLSDVTNFTPWSGDERWGNFNYSLDLSQYSPRSYTLWAQANDQSGATSNIVRQTFEVNIAPNQFNKITASDGQADDSFGQNVSLDGNTLLVGAAQDDDNGLDSGSAYIFNNINGVWTQKAKLKPKDGKAGDLFGDTIRLNGSMAFVGSWKRSSGSMYIFEESGGLWTETAKLKPSDGKAGDRFGSSFDRTDSGTILIGAASADQKGLDSGCVYIYKNVDGAWTETGKIYASDPSPGALFGRYIDIDGNQAVIGAVNSNGQQQNSGSVYIYENVNGVWTETAKLSASDGKNGDEFGTPSAIEDNTIVVGASENDGAKGAAYVFEKVGGAWRETAKLTASDGEVGEEFGTSVTISGNTIAVSPRHDDDKGVDSGSVYIFQKINGIWTEVYKLTAADGSAGDVFGKRVVIDGDTLVVSAFKDDSEVPDSGSVYIYPLSSLLPNPVNPITLTLSPTTVSEDGTTNLVYTFTRTGIITSALTVNYSVAGTATLNSDYTQTGAASFTATTGTITFAANSATATLTIDPTADTSFESDETVALTLISGTGYTFGTTTTVTGTITNDDLSSIVGTKNADSLTGTEQADLIQGLADNDTLQGLGGNDTLQGGNGDDILVGGGGDDTLTGGAGNDLLVGGLDNDFLVGGANSDQFSYQAFSDRGTGGDVISDFEPAADWLVLTQLFDSLGYSGSDPIGDGYLNFLEIGGSSVQVQIDSDGILGPANSSTLVTLHNISAADLVVGGNVLV